MFTPQGIRPDGVTSFADDKNDVAAICGRQLPPQGVFFAACKLPTAAACGMDRNCKYLELELVGTSGSRTGTGLTGSGSKSENLGSGLTGSGSKSKNLGSGTCQCLKSAPIDWIGVLVLKKEESYFSSKFIAISQDVAGVFPSPTVPVPTSSDRFRLIPVPVPNIQELFQFQIPKPRIHQFQFQFQFQKNDQVGNKALCGADRVGVRENKATMLIFSTVS
ncbi:hypothetical protein LXL04_019674 [Taraxacum kok-saghyz]